jgi:chitin synthase
MAGADTQVYTDALSHMVSHMARDMHVAGTCGDTNLASARHASVTSRMFHVCDSFFSQRLSKSFESLFGSVNRLPSCFCMYRVRYPANNTPVLVSPQVLADYAEQSADNTLHMTHLLDPDDDSHLTTLILEHFPYMKTTFVVDAKCNTCAHDDWSVLLSKKRRRIHATIHNLFELLVAGKVYSFSSLSTRLVAVLGLLATLVQPSALLYAAFLVAMAIVRHDMSPFPVVSLTMLAAVYAFQVVFFVVCKGWRHLGWMVTVISLVSFLSCMDGWCDVFVA